MLETTCLQSEMDLETVSLPAVFILESPISNAQRCPVHFQESHLTGAQYKSTVIWKCHDVTAFLYHTGAYFVCIKMPRLEEVANVVLRVPSILVLDMLYKCDIDSFTDHLKARTEDMLFKYKYVIWNIYYLGNYYVIIMSRYIVVLVQYAACNVYCCCWSVLQVT